MAEKLTLFEAEVDYRDAQMSVDKFLSKTEGKSKSSGKTAGAGFSNSAETEMKKMKSPTAAYNKIERDAAASGKKAGSGFAAGMKEKLSDLGGDIKSVFAGAFGGFAAANLLSSGISKITSGFSNAINSAQEFETTMRSVQGITGASDELMAKFGKSARSLAITFGTGVVEQLDTFKGIMSKLGPDLAKSPESLDAMTKSVNTLAKASGLDAATSMEALTGTMNAFQISIDDPMKASEEMARIMNILAAGAKEGASEIPQTAEAMNIVGTSANAANVSLEETNAAVQVLSKNNLLGAEAGTKLRNVLGTLAKGKYLPKAALVDLKKAGVDTDILSDKSKSLSERLQALKPIQENMALVTKTFGVQNAAAALSLIKQTDSLDDFTKKLTGSTVAQEQANLTLDTFAERMKSLKQFVVDIGIGIGSFLINTFNTLYDVTLLVIDNFNILAPIIIGIAVNWGILNAQLIANTVATKAKLIWDKLAIAVTWLWKVAQDALNFSFAANPIGAVVKVISLLVAGVIVAYNKSETFRDIVDGLWQSLQELWDIIMGIGKDLLIWLGLMDDDATASKKSAEEKKKLAGENKKAREELDKNIQVLQNTAKANQLTTEELEKEKKALIESTKATKLSKEAKEEYIKTINAVKTALQEQNEEEERAKTILEEIKDKLANKKQEIQDYRKALKLAKKGTAEYAEIQKKLNELLGKTDAPKKQAQSLDELKKKYIELKEPSEALYSQIVNMTLSQTRAKEETDKLNKSIGDTISLLTAYGLQIDNNGRLVAAGYKASRDLTIATTEAGEQVSLTAQKYETVDGALKGAVESNNEFKESLIEVKEEAESTGKSIDLSLNKVIAQTGYFLGKIGEETGKGILDALKNDASLLDNFYTQGFAGAMRIVEANNLAANLKMELDDAEMEHWRALQKAKTDEERIELEKRHEEFIRIKEAEIEAVQKSAELQTKLSGALTSFIIQSSNEAAEGQKKNLGQYMAAMGLALVQQLEMYLLAKTFEAFLSEVSTKGWVGVATGLALVALIQGMAIPVKSKLKSMAGAKKGTDFSKSLQSHSGRVESDDVVPLMITKKEAKYGILSDMALDKGGRIATNRELAQIMNKGGSVEDYILQRAAEMGISSDINSSAILDELRIISRTNEAISRKEMRTIVNVNVVNDNWRR